jgi:hypothetical protein
MARITIIAAAALSALALAAPVAIAMPSRDAIAASAAPYSPPTTTRSDAAQSGGDAPNRASHAPIVGDDIRSHPGMPGMPKYDPPTTIEVVRPERTIVRDVDQALPLVLSSAALLLVLTSLGVTLVRARMLPRPGRSN